MELYYGSRCSWSSPRTGVVRTGKAGQKVFHAAHPLELDARQPRDARQPPG
jgi:hypothetical protein